MIMLLKRRTITYRIFLLLRGRLDTPKKSSFLVPKAGSLAKLIYVPHFTGGQIPPPLCHPGSHQLGFLITPCSKPGSFTQPGFGELWPGHLFPPHHIPHPTPELLQTSDSLPFMAMRLTCPEKGTTANTPVVTTFLK